MRETVVFLGDLYKYMNKLFCLFPSHFSYQTNEICFNFSEAHILYYVPVCLIDYFERYKLRQRMLKLVKYT
jgi:hypothetical protein